MKVSYTEALSTPIDVIMRDLEYISIERSFEKSKKADK